MGLFGEGLVFALKELKVQSQNMYVDAFFQTLFEKYSVLLLLMGKPAVPLLLTLFLWFVDVIILLTYRAINTICKKKQNPYSMCQ